LQLNGANSSSATQAPAAAAKLTPTENARAQYNQMVNAPAFKKTMADVLVVRGLLASDPLPLPEHPTDTQPCGHKKCVIASKAACMVLNELKQPEGPAKYSLHIVDKPGVHVVTLVALLTLMGGKAAMARFLQTRFVMPALDTQAQARYDNLMKDLTAVPASKASSSGTANVPSAHGASKPATVSASSVKAASATAATPAAAAAVAAAAVPTKPSAGVVDLSNEEAGKGKAASTLRTPLRTKAAAPTGNSKTAKTGKASK
jgi:hypothetical protein